MSAQIDFQKKIKKTKAYIHFEDETTFEGWINLEPNSPLLIKGIWGEAAFTTGMTGYQETATDPSFLGQHIIYTNSHIGNYPSEPNALQSKQVHASSLIARNFSYNSFLDQINVPLFHGIDTRALTRYLSQKSHNHKSVITGSPTPPSKEEFKVAQLNCSKLQHVSINKPEEVVAGNNPIVLIDYGCKESILSNLKDLKLPLVRLPYNATKEQILTYQPRLVFLSNGPGDPREMDKEVQLISSLLKEDIPIRGICLGHQLLGLALGLKITKLPFGQRGCNHPCFDHENNKVIITSQNHGYSIEQFIDKDHIIKTHSSLFDGSIEGIKTSDNKIRSVQFHPEANPGPSDGLKFFTEIQEYLEKGSHTIDTYYEEPDIFNIERKNIPYKKILLIGSGPIKIGQASEFDYSGTQACKALKEVGIDVVLLNSNPATIMTDPSMSYKTYIEPITKSTIKKIIQKENVDAVLSTMGGQTALNICVELEEEEWLSTNNVHLLGANVDTIKKTEDRDLFAKELKTLGYQTGKRFSAKNEREVLLLANSTVHYPLMIRKDFALGGKGAALVRNEAELKEILQTTDIQYPLTMEKSLLGWKEVELEVMVDCEKNGVIICSIENVDPCGIHTGDSITVAPAQTISDRCMQKMRDIALTVAKHMNVVAGGANVQFAINPIDENDIVVIEMNPRVSRSSALASKATGYPIAKISAMLAVGYTLKEILNDITKVSPVSFEPTLDYVAVKIPIFPFNKFPSSSQVLGPQMRSVGEVLALGSSFNEAFFKALRSLEIGLEIPYLSQLKTSPIEINHSYLIDRLKNFRELSLLTVLEGLRAGISVKDIELHSKISSWFIEQVEQAYELENLLKNNDLNSLSKEVLLEAKRNGFSDKHIAFLIGSSQKDVFLKRLTFNLAPSFKAVDTCSGEFKAETPYFYSTYYVENEATKDYREKETIVTLGSGPNRIGQGIEFDYSCVKSSNRLQEKGFFSVLINSNPETVSTDYDSSDRLYLSPLYSEDIFDILQNEDPKGVITCFAGQTGIGVREYIEKSFYQEQKTFNFLGAPLGVLELTENRRQFYEVTKETSLKHTKAIEVSGYKKFINAALEIGFPLIVRPNYVIGGESMYILKDKIDLDHLPKSFKKHLHDGTTIFQVENYLEDATEYDVDLIRDKFGNTVFTVCEHIEYAGVHSGDSGMVAPPKFSTKEIIDQMETISKKIASQLEVIGPINFQFASKGSDLYCIEANPRGSRTLPFLSKAFDIDLPSIATDALLGLEIPNISDISKNYYAVKQSTFPFDRFPKDDIILGPKMLSTGESMGIDYDYEKATFKSYLANYPNMNKTKNFVLSLADQDKNYLKETISHLKQYNFKIYATPGTGKFLSESGIKCTIVEKVEDKDKQNILDIINQEDVSLVFNTPQNNRYSATDGEIIRAHAIAHGIPCFTRGENIKAVLNCLISMEKSKLSDDWITPISLQEIYQS